MKEKQINLAILASGGGSNADKICAYFRDHKDIQVVTILTNRKKAGVIEVAAKHNVPCRFVSNTDWNNSKIVLPILSSEKITHIILAGFLLLIPHWLVDKYRGRILNIHPALLPKYGGKGMFGMNVHQRVKESGDLISGITIHEVDEHYDEGDIVFQEIIELDPEDSALEIASKVLQLEHYHYPRVIEKWALDNRQ